MRLKVTVLFLALGLNFIAPATAQTPPEVIWPSTITKGNVTATIYEPQPTAWPGETTLNATAAVMLQKTGAKPVVGTIDITAQTQTDISNRWVTVSNIQLLDTHFPALDTNQAATVEAKIKAFAATLPPKRIPLDTVLLGMEQAPAAAKPVITDNTPPVIFHSASPAVLVVIDGAPVLSPIGKTGLSLVMNTNWNLFEDTTTGNFYLLDGASWLSAPVVTGPYQPAGKLPSGFSKLPHNANYADVLKHIPGTAFPPGAAPTVFISNKPAEIIVTNGPPQLAPVAGAPLQYVSNASAEIIFDRAGKLYYVLLSGRWFSAPGLDGPWAYATPNLPATFSLIPPDGPQSDVLASVPGTAQAQEAVITAQIPTQASLPRATTTTQVTYVGTPNFALIPGTTLQYAVNTPSQVILANGMYYVCANGAWFVAATPNGPFVLAASIPQVIYTIPPSFPLYPVTYVHIYSVTPTVIVTGYTAGYTMGLISPYGVVVYGTGYYYPPVIIPALVPVYFPYPYSYAGGYVYHSSTGAWVSGGAVYGPYGGAAARSAYNPATGAYAHGAAAWGPNGGYAQGSFSNPTTGAEGAGYHNNATGNNTAAAKTANGDVYAGHNGNVYQHTDSGWSKWDNGSNSFQPVQPPAHPTSSTQNYQRPSSASSPSASASRPSQPQPQSRPSYSGGSSSGGDFNQVQHDQQARQGGFQRQSSFGGGGGFGGGRSFGGGGGFGGGRHR